MQRLTVSTVMVAYHRHEQLANTLETYLFQSRQPEQVIVVEDGYDGGLTENVCRRFTEHLPIEWICRRNRPDVPFSNASIPRNIGIRRATGDIVILQNAEVRFTANTDLERVVEPLELDPQIGAVCAPCKSLNPDGSFRQWFSDPDIVGNVNHFAMSFRREHLIALGGFDEIYRGYGTEDDDFNYRFNRLANSLGLRIIFAANTVVEHQWHEQPFDPNNKLNEIFNNAYAQQMVTEIMAGKRTIKANVGKNWGDISS